MDPEIKASVMTILQEQDHTTLTRKLIRHQLEEKYGKERITPLKKELKIMIKEFTDTMETKTNTKTKKNKRKREGEGEEEEEEEPPKKLAALQKDIMTTAEFMEQASPLDLTVFHNRVTGPPRVFKGKSKGWYAGGKIKITVGDTEMWAQLGVNLTIIGSKGWEE